MNLQENIKRILREETQIPLHVRRRLKSTDEVVNELKKNSLRYMNSGSIISAIMKGSYFTASEMIPYEDEYDNNYSLEVHEKMSETVSDYLMSEYSEEIKDYLIKSIPNGSFNDDGFNYVFWKHSDRYGGNGFSELYPTWAELMSNKGWWFPLDWGDIKSELDRLGETDLLILNPGDKYNTSGYYFSIRKRKKD
jgi:predicted house-cleaning noncanonical NTP pyrophosphatase (MazG superfamily)